MRTWLPVISAVLLLVSTGCRSLTPTSTGSIAPLNESDLNTAQALAHYGQGLLYEAQEGPASESAYEHYAAAAELAPGERTVTSRVAISALHRRRPLEAVPYLVAACRTTPTDIDAWIDLAAAYRLTNQPDLALAAYRQALTLDPTATALYLAIAVVLSSEEREAESLEILTQARSQCANPQLIRAFVHEYANRLIARGATADAISCMERLVEWDATRHPSYYLILGELNLLEQQTVKAEHYYRLAIAEEAALPLAYIHLASLLLIKDPAAAISLLADGCQRFPEESSLHVARAYTLSDSGQLTEAVSAFETAWDLLTQQQEGEDALSPGIDFYLQYGAICNLAGLKEKAIDIFEACLVLYPKAHRVLNYLAYMWAVQDTMLDRALEYVERAIALDASNAAYLDTRGWVHYRMGAFDKALQDTKRALELYGNDAEILTHLGMIHEARGERSEAIKAWQDAAHYGTPGADATRAAIESLRQRDADVPPPAATPTK